MNKNIVTQHSNDLIQFLQNSPCSFLAVENTKNTLDKANFECLDEVESWELKEGGKYYITRNNSTMIAFVVGENPKKTGFRLIASHTDSPSFTIKPNAQIKVSDNYLKLNTEGYGGMILSTWLDRPLSIAGRVILKSKDLYKPNIKMIDFKEPIAIIPNLAIHLNRTVNEGYKYSKQNEMLPLLSLTNESFNEENYLNKLIAKQIDVNLCDIVDYELFLYEAEKGSIIGVNGEFISASRMDDLMMVYNSLEAFTSYANSDDLQGIKVLYIADNEEIGSETGEGADSSLLRDILKRICISLFEDAQSFYNMAEKSVFISADLAHALHPNYIDKHDITNKPMLNKGVCIKYSSSKKYSTTGTCTAIFEGLCENANIKHQKFVNHSDMIGGSTIGPMLASRFNTKVIDIGVCVLAMHSIRELASINDIYDCYKLFKEFYAN